LSGNENILSQGQKARVVVLFKGWPHLGFFVESISSGIGMSPSISRAFKGGRIRGKKMTHFYVFFALRISHSIKFEEDKGALN
jgi:hypothetical protein